MPLISPIPVVIVPMVALQSHCPRSGRLGPRLSGRLPPPRSGETRLTQHQHVARPVCERSSKEPPCVCHGPPGLLGNRGIHHRQGGPRRMTGMLHASVRCVAQRVVQTPVHSVWEGCRVGLGAVHRPPGQGARFPGRVEDRSACGWTLGRPLRRPRKDPTGSAHPRQPSTAEGCALVIGRPLLTERADRS